MDFLKLIYRNLLHYKKINSTVFFAVVLSAAILTGGLIIGDSIRYSLNEINKSRLGNTQFVVTAGERFFSESLGHYLSEYLGTPYSSVLIVNGVAINSDEDKRVNKTQIIGIDHNFSSFGTFRIKNLKSGEAILSEKTAQKLLLNIGDEFLIKAEKPGFMPVNAPFVSEDNTSLSLRMTVRHIAKGEIPENFSLQSNQHAPDNIFISLPFLTKKMGLEGYCNLILLEDKPKLGRSDIQTAIHKQWMLKDANLKLDKIKGLDKYRLSSSRVFIEDNVVDKIKEFMPDANLVFTYFVNSFSFKNNVTPYSFVSAAGSLLADTTIGEKEIIVNSWLADDLEANVGDSILLKYFITGPFRTLKEESSYFTIKDIVAIDSLNHLQELMPQLPGLSDAGNCRDWESGIPINFTKIRPKDEDYWKLYSGLPKAYVNHSTAKKIWGNRYGSNTSIWFDRQATNIKDIERSIRNHLKPIDVGIVAYNIKKDNKEAADNSVDFGQLFLSLSFFILASAILLTALLFSLNIKMRSKEIGILSGIGFTHKQIRNIFITEGAVIALLGSLIGGILGIYYNKLILIALRSVWQGAVMTDNLQTFVRYEAVSIGIVTTLIISFLSIVLSVKNKLKHNILGLQNAQPSLTKSSKTKITVLLSISVLFITVAIVLLFSTNFEASLQNAPLFMGAGALILLGSLVLVSVFLLHITSKPQVDFNLMSLCLRYISNQRARSISIIVLTAIGTFSVILTGANRKNLEQEAQMRHSGTGGFMLWCESALPILHQLNSGAGKLAVGSNTKLLQDVSYMQIRTLNGGDASCLNLNRVQHPRLLGVDPSQLQKRKAFSFVSKMPDLDKNKLWSALNKPLDDNTIPAIADQTVILWGLGKSVGDTLTYINERGEKINLKLIAGLASSVFQGNILIADSLLLHHFPSLGGSQLMLVDGDFSKRNEIQEELQSVFKNYGIEISRTDRRLQEFNVIENTYLSIFLLLGGLGIIIGVVGIGIVLAQNVIERKSELMLFSSLGYRQRDIMTLLLVENISLLATGVVCGSVSAFVGTIHVFISGAAGVPWGTIFLLIFAILLNGVLFIWLSAVMSLKTKLLNI